MKIDYCPSTLAEGFHTYSPAAIKQLFSGHGVSHILNEGDDAFLTGAKAGTAMRRISVSGAQEKFPANKHLTMQIAFWSSDYANYS